MGRFLFVVPPLAGHVNPTVAVGTELRARGHDVAWSAHPDHVGRLLPDDAVLLPASPRVPEAIVDAITHKAPKLRATAALRFLWEDFILPLGEDMRAGVEAAVDAFAPDVLVVDQQAIAGAAVAVTRKLPWATSATTSAELNDPLRAMPKVAEWVRGLITDHLVAAGLEPDTAAATDPRFSDRLVVVFSTAELVGPGAVHRDQIRFVGPAVGGRPDRSGFPWDELDGRPLVLVSLGSLNGHVGERFFGVVCDAFRSLDAQAVLVAPPGVALDPPPNVLVRDWVPQPALLEQAAAVVTHAGHNTVCESLAQGLPMVLAPIRDDQPIVAGQVEAAGAGVRVKFGRVGPEQLGQAVTAVLTEPSYRRAAARIGASFAAAGGPAEAARLVEGLLTDPPSTAPPPDPGSTEEGSAPWSR